MAAVTDYAVASGLKTLSSSLSQTGSAWEYAYANAAYIRPALQIIDQGGATDIITLLGEDVESEYSAANQAGIAETKAAEASASASAASI
ncbi:hypothetical protein K4A07_17945, partial [Lactiplantibacillus plantarum]|nr:hypothetical protein [Lactiplantibacillus plantarum]